MQCLAPSGSKPVQVRKWLPDALCVLRIRHTNRGLCGAHLQAEQIAGARGQLEALTETHGAESAAAAEQKTALDRMNEETQALMEAAKREQAAAEQRHKSLMEVRRAASGGALALLITL